MVTLPAQGDPCAMDCRWCGGPRTLLGAPVREEAARLHAHACMRCDTSDQGDGQGPPRFMRIWNERRAG